MKEPDHFGETLPDGVQLTLSELREMACRQQAQIDSQHQLLAAKEQRLRYLKEQEARQQRVQAESERLRRLRDRVDAQELKLRKLRALRGQVDHQKQNNISLTSDLDSIRALFNEKEKELSLAVAKVEELTRQLEELRRGRNGTATPASNRDQQSSTASALELDKLRRELMYRNKLNEQQNQRLNQQREALTARQEEMSAIDKRISELQERLHKKRLLNQQLANQISAASHKAAYQQLVRLTGNDVRKQQLNNTHHQPPNGLSRGNIAAVEPYNHLPLRTPQSQSQQQQQQQPQQQIKQELTYHPVYQSPTITNQQQHIKKDTENNDDLLNNKITNSYQQQQQQEFTVSKSDPKYQTLPYNTKFTVNLIPNRIIRNNDNDNNNNTNELVNNNDNNKENIENISPTTTSMTVHSAPLNIANKNIATPLNHQNDLIINNNNNNKTAITTTTTTTYQKPISSVAPTSIQHSNILSNIYQTSSIKIQPVEPQTTTTNNNNNNNNKVQSPSLSLPLSPPNGTSTPLNSTSEISIEKPALPPKPVIKPPPRQTINNIEESQQQQQQQQQPPPLPLSEPPDETKLRQQQEMVIKAKPLTIKKQQQCEQPKLRSNLKLNQSRFNYGEQQQQLNDDNNDKIDKKSSPSSSSDEIDKIDETITVQQSLKESSTTSSSSSSPSLSPSRRCLINNNNNNNGNKKGNLKNNKTTSTTTASRRVSFDPLALLLDASLEGELELVKKTAQQVPNPSAANDEGITALHNAICAGHLDIVQYLVNFGCDVNAQDSDGWTPLHCAASCNNVAMVKFLVEHGACIFATTLSDHETAAEKCEEDEEGFDGCSEYLYSVQEKLGILSGGVVYAVFDYTAQQPDELSFKAGQQLTVLRKGDENEREWWWSRLGDKEGYVPRNLLGLYPRVNRKEDDKD